MMSASLSTARRGALGLAAAVLLAGCSDATGARVEGPGADVRDLTGAPTRIVWVQSEESDPGAEGTRLVLMGLDTHDGKGERAIVGTRGSFHTPMLTARGDRIVFSTRVLPGPPEIFLVNWDGSGLRKLADGFALDVWESPADGREWVYAGTENTQYDFTKVTRFPIDAPAAREAVWNASMVSMEGFHVSADGRQIGGLFSWPNAGVLDLTSRSFRKLGEGCWTSMTNVRGPLFWYFDGAHRNVTMVDVPSGARWIVNVNNAPGFDGAEVSHPRWSNHPRFFAVTGPYNQGGENQVRTGGPQVEVYLGRFSADFSRVEGWARVTYNGVGDSHPDAWIDLARTPHPRRPAGPIGPPQAVASDTAGRSAGQARAGRLVLNVRLTRAGPIPHPQAILPYRSAMVVNEYEVAGVVQGRYGEKAIRIAQWAIRDSTVLAGARKTAGGAFTLTVERYDAHPELEGERLLSDRDDARLTLYYDVTDREAR